MPLRESVKSLMKNEMSNSIHHLKVEKTARVVASEPGPGIRQVWLIAHGYGYLATFFINKFDALDRREHLLIVPEGLHRYYLNAVSGRVGASWMTKEDRLLDIDDYCRYLDQVYEKLILPLDSGVIVNALGFSQGGATISRWAAYTKHHIDNIIMWGSGIPPDMNWEEDLEALKSFHWLYVAGNDDLYLTPEQRSEQLALLEKHGIAPEMIAYEGGHDIEPGTLKLLTEKCVKVKR